MPGREGGEVGGWMLAGMRKKEDISSSRLASGGREKAI